MPKDETTALLAVLQYDFLGANPAASCPSICLLVRLVPNQANWQVADRYLLETSHHHSITAMRLLDLTGTGADHLLIESTSGGAGNAQISLQVFDLSTGHLAEVLRTESWMEYMMDTSYTQKFDLQRTRKLDGQSFCFTKTTRAENSAVFDPPRVTHPCYPRGAGVVK